MMNSKFMSIVLVLVLVASGYFAFTKYQDYKTTMDTLENCNTEYSVVKSSFDSSKADLEYTRSGQVDMFDIYETSTAISNLKNSTIVDMVPYTYDSEAGVNREVTTLSDVSDIQSLPDIIDSCQYRLSYTSLTKAVTELANLQLSYSSMSISTVDKTIQFTVAFISSDHDSTFSSATSAESTSIEVVDDIDDSVSID